MFEYPRIPGGGLSIPHGGGNESWGVECTAGSGKILDKEFQIPRSATWEVPLYLSSFLRQRFLLPSSCGRHKIAFCEYVFGPLVATKPPVLDLLFAQTDIAQTIVAHQ